MEKTRVKAILVLLCALCACQPKEQTVTAPPQVEEIKPSYDGEAIELPLGEGTAEPNLLAHANSLLYLSWIQQGERGHSLMYATYGENGWTEPIAIAKGSDWFVNWADFPSMAVRQDGSMAAHWLQKNAEGQGTYDYDVRIAQSSDGGVSWGDSFLPHRDGKPAEHGFVSMRPYTDGRILAIWLDARKAKEEEHDHKEGHDHSHDSHGQAGMTLRAAAFDAQGRLSMEEEIDDRVCDCCQTDLAITAKGPVAIYRNRSEKFPDVRDIHIARLVKGKWVNKSIFDDGWQINGCPVNGPSIDAKGEDAVAVWYTEATQKREVKLAFSHNSAESFGKPMNIGTEAVIGRADVVLLDAATAIVSWMELEGQGAYIKLAKVTEKDGVVATKTLGLTSSARISGFPRLQHLNDQCYVAWTDGDPASKKTKVCLTKVGF